MAQFDDLTLDLDAFLDDDKTPVMGFTIGQDHIGVTEKIVPREIDLLSKVDKGSSTKPCYFCDSPQSGYYTRHSQIPICLTCIYQNL